MTRRIPFAPMVLAIALFVSGTTRAQDSTSLKIDPLLLVSLNECRNIARELGDRLFSGWAFDKTPVLFYRPNVQELLINFPHKPAGFSRYAGFNPLADDPIYCRTDTTLIPYDDQNTSRNIDSINVLVVADPYSTMRNQLRDVVTRPKPFVDSWLNSWNFIPDPYEKITTILHEGFHVYQQHMAPDKWADEGAVAHYPLLDPRNNALFVLEGNILKDALLTRDPAIRLEKTREFVAVRTYRQAQLDTSSVEYENLVEYSEGLARYVEYAFLTQGETLTPLREMQYVQGFHGYRDVLSRRFTSAIRNMVNIVAVSDDRFGNKFGSGPLRFKLYDLGACQALLLDDLMPHWKETIFGSTTYLTDLLRKAVGLTAGDLNEYLAKARKEYAYDTAYQDKVAFEQEGKRLIDAKVSSILKTTKTLVRISYGDAASSALVARYTPFGVTQAGKQATIYELVPLLVYFKKGITLNFKQPIPVLVDEEKQQIVFAIDTPSSRIPLGDRSVLDLDELVLKSPMSVSNTAGTIDVRLR